MTRDMHIDQGKNKYNSRSQHRYILSSTPSQFPQSPTPDTIAVATCLSTDAWLRLVNERLAEERDQLRANESFMERKLQEVIVEHSLNRPVRSESTTKSAKHKT
jgi:hypothetical protein